MATTFIIKSLVILGSKVISGKELELKDIVLTTLGGLNPLSDLTDLSFTSLDTRNLGKQIDLRKIDDLQKFYATVEITLTDTDTLLTGVKDGIEVLYYDKVENSGWVLVGIKRKGKKTPFLSGIAPGQLGTNIEYRYEVQGNFYDKIGSSITIQRKNGRLVNIPIVQKKEEIHGMMVYYNVPDFDEFSLAMIDIPEDIIQLDASKHKQYAIKELARMFHNKEIAKGVFSPEIEVKLEKIYTTGKVPTCLPGCEIHHDGNGRMQFIPRDIHCRRTSHLSGSWLMNHLNYGLSILNNAGEAVVFDRGSLKLSVELLNDQRLSIILESFSKGEIEKYIAGSFSERKDIILTLSNQIKEAINIKDTTIAFKPMSRRIGGYYDLARRQIAINENLLAPNGDYEETINTLLHEMRHVIQHDAICNPSKYDFSTELIAKWKYEIENYTSSEFDFEAYAKQSIEIDAREWADYYTSLLNA